MAKDYKFEVGDRVRIHPESEYYNDGDNTNPVGTTGTVDEISTTGLPVGVAWSNGTHNCYEHDDLYPWFETGDEIVLKKYDRFHDIQSHDGEVATVMNVAYENNMPVMDVRWVDGETSTIDCKLFPDFAPTLANKEIKPSPERAVKESLKLTKKLDIRIDSSTQIVGQDEVRKHLKIAIKQDMPVLLVGDTGTGKTSIVRQLAQEAGHSWSRFNLTGETTVDEFVGKWTLQDGNTVWQDGILLQAMRKGQWLVVDEINVALPEILFVLHSLLDDDKFVVVPQKDGEVVKPHASFRFFGTMNPVDEYAGTKDLNKAFKSRFNMIINMEYPEREIETEIVRQKCDISEEQARTIVDVGVMARQLKKEDKIFYTCSTRDLIQWGHLVRGGLDLETAFNLSIVGKANGDSEQMGEVFKKVTGAYESARKQGFPELNIDALNKTIAGIKERQKQLDEDISRFEAEKESLIEATKEETIRRLLTDAQKKTTAKKATPKKKATTKAKK